MATLAGFSGRDLFSGPSPLQGVADAFRGIIQQQKEQEANEAFGNILTEGVSGFEKTRATQPGTPQLGTQDLSRVVPGGISSSQMKNLQILGKLDPAKAKMAFDIIRTGQAEQIQSARAQVKKRGLIALGLKRQKNPAKRAEMARQFAEADPSQVGQFSAFLKMSPDAQDTFLDKSILEARTFDEVLGASLKPPTITEIKSGQDIRTIATDPATGESRFVATAPRFAPKAPSASFESVVDEEGNVIAQRNTVTGEIKKTPLAGGGVSEKATFAKSPGVVVELEDGTFAQAIPVIDTRTGQVVNKLSPIPGQPVSRLGETAEGETLRQIREKRQIKRATGQETRLQTTINDGITAAEGLATLDRSVKLLENIKTGGLAGAQLRFEQFLGVQGADEAELSANLLRTVLAQLRPTFGAAFTEREGKRLEGIEAGIGKSTAGNIRILKQLKTIISREARRGLAAAKKTGDDFSFNEIDDLMKFKISAPEGGAEDLSKLSIEQLLAR